MTLPLPVQRISRELSPRATHPGTARTGQRVAAFVLLVLALPVLFALWVAIRLDSPGRAIFRQSRTGLNGTPFTMYKLRTMTVGTVHDGRPKAPGDERVTCAGRFLRRSSLDELPQLVNVIRGDMALVGPRPLLSCDVGSSEADVRRLEVLPGMTGLWQVSGRCNLDQDQALLVDVEYVDTWSHRLDARILLRTIAAVWRGEGAY